MSNQRKTCRIIFGLACIFLCTTGKVFAQTADFISNTTTGCAPFTINFSDQSSPTPVAWAWDFGDGNTSTSKDPTNVYYNPGVYTVTLEVTFPNNSKVTVIKADFITIHKKPVAEFTATNVSGCKDLPVTFINQSTAGSGAITGYTWDFGNSFSDTAKNPTHLFRSAGKFDVKLIVTDANGCTSLKDKKALVDVWQTPDANFSSSSNIGCSTPHQVSFVNTTIDNASGTSQYWWNFGEGTTSTQKTPNNTYYAYGKATVTLVVQNSLGCRDTLIQTNFVDIQSVKANFTVTPSGGCSPLVVNFLNNTNPKLSTNTYEWSFGNGAKSSAQDTVYTYYSAGTYDIKLRVTTAGGCKDSMTKAGAVQVTPGPRATFYANDSLFCRNPATVNFYATGAGVNFFWEFGDGTTSTQKNPVKIYADTGKFKVKLTATSTNGCVDSVSILNLIKIHPPVADFKPSVESGCAPLQVSFANATKTYSLLAEVTYKFGDGNTSNKGFVNHTYLDTGVYVPWIYVKTDDGCVDSAMYDTIRAGMEPNADFTVDKLFGCSGQLWVHFKSITNQTPGPVKADWFEWFPGTGQRVVGEEVDFLYDADSRFYDVLLVASHYGCPDSMTKKNLIEVLSPSSRFMASSLGCSADSFYFSNTSLGGTRFKWLFGDGDSLITDTATNPSHSYLPGEYNPKLIVYDSTTGCEDTSDQHVVIISSDVLKFRSDTAGCTRQLLWFFDQTPGSSDWMWKVGEAEICTTRNCQIAFTEPGWKDVIFSAVVGGCRYTKVAREYVHVYGPGFEFLTPPDPICAPKETEVITRIHSEKPLKTTNLWIYEGFNLVGQQSGFGDTLLYYFDEPPADQNLPFRFYYYAQDSAGCINFKTDSIDVLRPEVEYINRREATCIGDLQFFAASVLDSSSPGPLTYQWDFGDGTVYTVDSLTAYHTFQTDQVYPVSLVAFDAKGCSDTVLKNLAIDVRNIKADFHTNDTYASCPPFVVNIQNKSTDTYNGITLWEWRLGDGTGGNAVNPLKIYNEPGVYDVFLKVTDTFGCVDSLLKPAYIRVEGTKISYSFDVDSGCQPLSVRFQATAGVPVDFRWNAMDGTPIYEMADLVHTYTEPGQYNPTVFVKDLSGCQYVLMADDTITVIPAPIADFTVAPTCLGDPSNFVNTTDDRNELVEYTWLFSTTDSTDEVQPSRIFPAGGEYTVKLKALSERGCYDEVTKKALVSDPKGVLVPDALRVCAEDTLGLELVNLSPGRVVSITWYPEPGLSFITADSVTSYVYTKKGYYRPQLVFVNEFGCDALVVSADSILVGDNFAPTPPMHLRSTVDNNDQTSIWIEAKPDIDFEKYIFYRYIPNLNRFDSIGEHLNQYDTVFTDPVPTLNSTYTYRVVAKNFCGYYSDPLVQAHTTMELKASTYDDASFLQWTPYGGWPVQRYEIWRLDPAQGFVKIKETDGNTLETYDSAIACRTGYYYQIRAIGPGAENFSLSDTSGAIPNYIPYVPSNELYSASVEAPNRNLVTWNFVNPSKAPVRYYVLERSTDGVIYREAGRFDAFTHYTMDKVDSAGTMSLYYRTVVQDTCGYRSEPSNYGKTVMLRAGTDTLDRPVLTWSAYEFWAEGVDYYEIEIFHNGNFEFLASVDGNTHTWTDDITELNRRPEYCYRVTARSAADGGKSARSNIACAPVRSRIFVPNAFHPGGLPDNTTFYPRGMYISEFTMRIYDRWGALIYETHSMDQGWDGTWKGAPMPPGVYVYKIDYKGVDKDFEMLSGTFFLLR